MHDLVNRRTFSSWLFGAREQLTPEQALRCYTVNSAFASFDEHRKGRISVGYLADLTVLSDDPVTVDPQVIKDIRVLRTVVNGETVHAV